MVTSRPSRHETAAVVDVETMSWLNQSSTPTSTAHCGAHHRQHRGIDLITGHGSAPDRRARRTSARARFDL